MTPGVAHILRPLVGAYLLLLAFRLWRQGSASSVSAADVRALDVFVATVFNPKALVFAVAVIPFQRPDVWTYFAAFLAVLGLAGAGWLTVGAAMGRAAPSGALTLCHGNIVGTPAERDLVGDLATGAIHDIQHVFQFNSYVDLAAIGRKTMQCGSAIPPITCTTLLAIGSITSTRSPPLSVT